MREREVTKRRTLEPIRFYAFTDQVVHIEWVNRKTRKVAGITRHRKVSR